MKTYSMDAENRGTPEFPFSIGTALLSTGGFETHSHSYAELVILHSGTGNHRIGSTVYPVRGGDLFVIPQGECHGFSQCRELTMTNLSFRPEFIQQQDFREVPGVRLLFDIEPQLRLGGVPDSRFHADPLQRERIGPLLEEMEQEFELKLPGYQTMFKTLLVRLILLLGRLYTQSDYKPAEQLWGWTEVMTRLEENFTEEIDLAELAGSGGYSYSHFIRLFRKINRTTPHQYILQLRISKAAALLQNSDLNISEIGWQCGFEDSNYFSRMFKKKVGVSPRLYRKENLAGGDSKRNAL